MKKLELKFYRNVKPLEIHEYKIWRRLLSKVLKVGIELEFNMDNCSGNCKGYNRNCICDNYGDESCGNNCIFLKDNLCKLKMTGVSNCLNSLSTCNSSKCITCTNFEFKCGNSTCVNYIPECILCEDLIQKCSNCKHRYNVTKTPGSIRKNVGNDLLATQNFGQVGKHGVLQVVADGSLKNGGFEVITVGRRFNFDTFDKMLSHILDVTKKNGGYIDERCSLHVHILNEYYTKTNNQNGTSRNPDVGKTLNINSFEKPMPNIILTNIVQLWRKYETAIYWLACTLPYNKNITRWKKFRVSLIPYSPILMSFSEIMESIGEIVGKKRYGSLNLANTRTDGSRLHLELRVCDMAMSKSYITAMCSLFYSLILKAVDISCYGLLNVEDTLWYEKETSIKNEFVNGAKNSYDSNRLSSFTLTDDHKEYLISKSHELISLLSPILSNFDPAEKILKKLADKPIAFRLIEAINSGKVTSEYNKTYLNAMNTYNIESELSENVREMDESEKSILKIVAVGKIQGCETKGMWIKEVASDISIPEVTIENYINNLVTEGDAYWNKAIGSYLYH